MKQLLIAVVLSLVVNQPAHAYGICYPQHVTLEQGQEISLYFINRKGVLLRIWEARFPDHTGKLGEVRGTGEWDARLGESSAMPYKWILLYDEFGKLVTRFRAPLSTEYPDGKCPNNPVIKQ